MQRTDIDNKKLVELQKLDEARSKQDWDKVKRLLLSSSISTQMYYINLQLDSVMSMSKASQSVHDVVDLIPAVCGLSHLNLSLFTDVSIAMIHDFSQNLMSEKFDTYWHDLIQLEQLLSNSFLCLTKEDQNAFKQHCQSQLYSWIQKEVENLKIVTYGVRAREQAKLDILEKKDESSINHRNNIEAYSDPFGHYTLLFDAIAAESSDSHRKERKYQKVHKQVESTMCRNALKSILAIKALRKSDDIIFKYYPLQDASQLEELRIHRLNMDRTIEWYGKTACELLTKNLEDEVIHIEKNIKLGASISIINEEDQAKKTLVFSKIFGELRKQLKGDLMHFNIHMFDNITTMLDILKNAYNENKSQNNLKIAKSIHKILSAFSSYGICTLNEENGPLDYSFDQSFISFKGFVTQHEKQVASLKL